MSPQRRKNKNEIRNFPKTVLTLMSFHHIWPKDNSRVTFRFIFDTLFLYSPSTLFYGSNILYLYYNFANPYIDTTECTLQLLIFFFSYYTVLIYLRKLNDVVEFIHDLDNFQTFEVPPQWEKLKKWHNLTVKLFYVYAVVGLAVYSAISFHEGLTCEEKNIKYHTENLCGLLSPLWLPFSLENASIKNEIFALQVIFELCTLLPPLVGTRFCIACIDMMLIRLKHLKEKIQEIDGMTKEERKVRLAWCVKYHNRIINLTKKFNDCFGSLSAIHFTLSSLILGILNHQLLKEWQFKAVTHHFGWTFAIYLLCRAGQNLINESTLICETLYFLNWYEYDTKTNFYVRMIMLRSQKQLDTSAGIFFSYSFELLLAIFEASYKYMTIMTQLDKLKALN